MPLWLRWTENYRRSETVRTEPGWSTFELGSGTNSETELRHGSTRETWGTKERAEALLGGPRTRYSSYVAGAVDNSGDSGCPGSAGRLHRGLVCRRRGLFHLRHRPHDWLWRYRTAAGGRARAYDRDWSLRALPHGPHSGDCGLRHANSDRRSSRRLILVCPRAHLSTLDAARRRGDIVTFSMSGTNHVAPGPIDHGQCARPASFLSGKKWKSERVKDPGPPRSPLALGWGNARF